MADDIATVWASNDAGLVAHWAHALPAPQRVLPSFAALASMDAALSGAVWVDLAMPGVPTWQSPAWQTLVQRPGLRVIAASSSPSDGAAVDALNAGCAAYCHAYSDAATLQQVHQVVALGHVWVGKSIMQKLLSRARDTAQAVAPQADWHGPLTEREREVAILAANGASNLAIARDCTISERTVKAHLGAVFAKLNITDRLQLALRVHGIS
jgi:DNA-binding NarL/FixJ family response regulator